MMYRIMASTVFGLESVLESELNALGFDRITKQDGRVFFEADAEGIAKANLCLRTAERVYIVIGEFTATDSDSLFEKIKELPFYRYITKQGEFPVDVNLVKTSERFASKQVTQKTVKKAIVESMRHHYRTEYFEETGERYHIYVNMIKDRVIVLLDTSGAGLNRRGYREYGNAAPLRETLAAALVLLSGWRTRTKLIDAFCGSGTILIEAAMIALGIPPNRNREFPFERWAGFSDLDMQNLRRIRTREPESDLKLEGYDIDPAAIRQARINAGKAGVSEYIHFQCRSVTALRTATKNGTLISNLPYGERLLDRQKASELNTVLGKVMRGEYAAEESERHRGIFSGWYKCFFTAHEDFEADYGEKAHKNRKLYNGGIKSYLYLFPPSSRAVAETTTASAHTEATSASVNTGEMPTSANMSTPAMEAVSASEAGTEGRTAGRTAATSATRKLPKTGKVQAK